MQPLPQHLKDLARRVAQHEMGHYVVATVLGFRCGDVSLEISGNGHKGGASVDLPTSTGSLTETMSYLERRVQVLFAGAAAETMRSTSPDKRVNQEQAIEILRRPGQGAEQDHAKVRELIHVLRNIGHPDTDSADHVTVQAELDAIDLDLWLRAIALVERHASAICGLASSLAEQLTHVGKCVTLEKGYLEALPGVRNLTCLHEALGPDR